MKFIRSLSFALGVGVLLCGCAPLTSNLKPFDRQTVMAGEWMGIEIGMDREDAVRVLLADGRFVRQKSYALTPKSLTCGDSDYVDNFKVEEFGATLHVGVFSEAGRVTCVQRWKRPFQLSG